MTRRILLTGATGFIGTHVVAALSQEQDVNLRVLVHRHDLPPRDGGPVVHSVRGDLTTPGSLRGICDGVDTVVHLASHVNGDPALSEAVNHRGTEALVAQARQAGVARLIYLSTAAVYGDGIHDGVTETELLPAPVSPVSASRRAAELSVLAAGGTVLRPMFVYGRGDLWFVPTVANFVRRLSVLVNGGRARVSTIAAEDLADVISALALTPKSAPSQAIYHVNHPEPVRVRDLVRTITSHLELPRAPEDISYEVLREQTTTTPRLARQLSLIAFDHWYDSSAIWRFLDRRPGPNFQERFAHYAPWYRGLAQH